MYTSATCQSNVLYCPIHNTISYNYPVSHQFSCSFKKKGSFARNPFAHVYTILYCTCITKKSYMSSSQSALHPPSQHPPLAVGPLSSSEITETTLLLDGTNDANQSELKDNTCFSTPFDFILPLNRCFVVPERNSVVQLYFGRYYGTIDQPGCYCRTNIGLQTRQIGTHLKTFEMNNVKILDSLGSPVILSAIITYRIMNAKRACIDVCDPDTFVKDQAPAVLKRVVSLFPYESNESSTPTLRAEPDIVAARMRDDLQRRVQIAGVQIHAFNINELSYAPEIAHAMLKRQQAHALIDARKAIVQGAKEIAQHVTEDISDHMTPEQKSKLLGNILLVLIGEKEVLPTLQM